MVELTAAATPLDQQPPLLGCEPIGLVVLGQNGSRAIHGSASHSDQYVTNLGGVPGSVAGVARLSPSSDAAGTRRRRSDGQLTRQKVLDAAIESILESGYYHTSSNEIARRAGVTWGTLQHQFGSREALLLEVLNDRWARLQAAVATADIAGETIEERLRSVLAILEDHYGKPSHLAQMQILLDLIQNPKTSDETRQAALTHGRSLARAWKPLFARALGEAAKEPDLIAYAFTTLRGFLVGEIVASRIAPQRYTGVERDLLVRGVAAAVRDEARARGIAVG